MSTEASGDWRELLGLAQAGDDSAQGQLLHRYRCYLALLARLQVGRRLECKFDASDLVQETFLKAHVHFDQFQGRTEQELLGWLRQILATTLANLVRHYRGARCRDQRLERELATELDLSSQALDWGLV